MSDLWVGIKRFAAYFNKYISLLMRQQIHQKRQVQASMFSVKPDLKEWQRGKQQATQFRRRPSYNLWKNIKNFRNLCKTDADT